MRTSKRIAAVTLALLAAAQLAGCGSDNKPAPAPAGDTGGSGNNGGGNTGGGGDTGGGGSTPGADSQGVFVDAPVAGLNYVTSSDITGITDSEGRYNYRAGDTVTFSIGGLDLGTVVAQGVVTPKTVAQALTSENPANTEAVATNLLVLLQSLDADGDPDNGITFTADIRDAVAQNASSIDLTADEHAFTASIGTFVAAVASEAQVPLTPVTRDDAVAHFIGNAPTALAGAYVLANESFEPITQKTATLTIFRNNRYLLGGHYDNASCNLEEGRTAKTSLSFSDANGNGVEHGRYSWNPMTNEFAIVNMLVETDGYCGLNEPDTESTNDITVLEQDPKGLVFKDSDGNVVYRFARLAPTDATFAGTWLQPTSLMANQPFAFTFFPSNETGTSGRYFMVDASFPDLEYDTSPGIEEGCYSVDANDNLSIEMNPSLCTDAIDTNDTAGAWSPDSGAEGLKLFVDANDRLVFDDGYYLTGFTRLPARLVTHETLEGVWMIEDGSGLPFAEQPQLWMLTVFNDGRFLFGTQENNESCVAPGYEADELDEAGNGVEYGELSLTERPGLVVPQNVTVDSNGECGLYHNGKTDDNGAPFLQAYFIAPSTDGDALVVWPNDDEDTAGIIFKRVPSVEGKITGAWLWEEAEDQFAVVTYLPGGVMFEASAIEGSIGILRESFTDDGATLISTNAGYEYCVDTQMHPSECLTDPPQTLEESYTIDGNTMTFVDVESDEEYSVIRLE